MGVRGFFHSLKQVHEKENSGDFLMLIILCINMVFKLFLRIGGKGLVCFLFHPRIHWCHCLSAAGPCHECGHSEGLNWAGGRAMCILLGQVTAPGDRLLGSLPSARTQAAPREGPSLHGPVGAHSAEPLAAHLIFISYLMLAARSRHHCRNYCLFPCLQS